MTTVEAPGFSRGEYVTHRQWLPQSGRQHGDGPEFEMYDEHFENDDSTLYIYIPVK